MSESAQKCRHCGEWLPDAAAEPEASERRQELRAVLTGKGRASWGTRLVVVAVCLVAFLLLGGWQMLSTDPLFRQELVIVGGVLAVIGFVALVRSR
ncbi:MAG: hypothetical protein O2895_04790 [Chloroflexi bacterium]|nr:hypothetical protein [Chloroflexota bacterium]